jgi:transcriptional regulator with XRE-family HTH domain
MASRKKPEDLTVEAHVRAHLVRYMTKRGTNEAEVARRMGITPGYVNKFLSGARGIGPGLILRMSHVLGVELATLMEEDPKKQ